MPGRARPPGLQVERTALAWRRTALSVAVAALLGTRVLATANPWWAVALVTGGLTLTVAMSYAASRRFAGGALSVSPGVSLLALVAGGQVLAGLVAMVLVIA